MVYKSLIIFALDSSQLDFRMLQLRVRRRSKLPTTTVWPALCTVYGVIWNNSKSKLTSLRPYRYGMNNNRKSKERARAARVARGSGELALVVVARVVEALREAPVGGVRVDALVAAGGDDGAVGAPGECIGRTRVRADFALREALREAAAARRQRHARTLVEQEAHDRSVCVSAQETV